MTKNNPINKKTSALLVNDEYSLPTVDGSSGTTLTTNGSGTVTWETLSGGKLIQEVSNSTSSYIQVNAAIPDDDTIPQKTEGREIITCSITPTSSTNILLIEVNSYFAGSMASLYPASGAIFQDDTSNAISATRLCYSTAINQSFIIRHRMVSGTTSATTFKLRFGTSTAQSTTAINGGSTPANVFGGVSSCIITIQEYKA
jgi:hypothetical protein